MGSVGATRVDTAALRAMARDYDTAAALIATAARNHLDGMRFHGSTAGQAYLTHGAEVTAALVELGTALRLWSRAAAEISAALRGSALRYEQAAARAADLIAAHG